MRRLAVTAVAVLVILAALALYGRGGDDGDPVVVSTATATPAATQTPAAPTTTATPAPATATPGTPTATPTPSATPSPTPSPTPTAPSLTPTAAANTVLPTSFVQLAATLAEPGLALTNAFDPACTGASVEPIVFAGPDFESSRRFAVWVFWPYPDRDAFDEEWTINAQRRAESLLAGCEPPSGFVYYNRHLLLWFVGFYGDDVAPGSPAHTPNEVRTHPVVQGFLSLRP